MKLFGIAIQHCQVDRLATSERKLLITRFHEDCPEARQRLTVAQGLQVAIVIWVVGVLIDIIWMPGINRWVAIGGGLVVAWALGRWGRRQVKRQFNSWIEANWQHGRPMLCLKCVYDLRGNTDADRCPECGEPVVHLD